MAIEIGTFARCPRFHRGKILDYRKAVVLDTFAPGNESTWLVWFYGMGPAEPGKNVQLMHAHEIHVLSDSLEKASERTLRKIERGLLWFSPDRVQVGWMASRLRAQKRAARLGH